MLALDTGSGSAVNLTRRNCRGFTLVCRWKAALDQAFGGLDKSVENDEIVELRVNP